MESIIVALIGGGVTLIGVLIANGKTQAVTDTKLEELTREVREHNNFARRVPVMEEQIKVINHRIADLETAGKRLTMDISYLSDYMIPVIVGLCLCVGYVTKKWVKDVDNKFIPTLCAALGVALACWASWPAIDAGTILAGMVSGLASTGLHQAFKQLVGDN